MKLFTQLLYNQLHLSIMKKITYENEVMLSKSSTRSKTMQTNNSKTLLSGRKISNGQMSEDTNSAENHDTIEPNYDSRSMESFVQDIQTTLNQIETRLSQHRSEDFCCIDEREISTANMEKLIKALKEEKTILKDYFSPKDLDFVETVELFGGLIEHMSDGQRARLFFKLKKILNVIMPSYRFHADNSPFTL
ncbi:uncharacterized protein LOC142337111 [Convolutriloba macropyga]|uniref:uncharacterized protein LOC142337111 n=1 Tax=Convolutriloba macropyga TaxID=536237 RepID=UPI003F528C39